MIMEKNSLVQKVKVLTAKSGELRNYVAVRLFGCLCVCVCECVCLSVCLYVCVSVCETNGETERPFSHLEQILIPIISEMLHPINEWGIIILAMI